MPDSDLCTTDSCNPAIGCVHKPDPDCQACCIAKPLATCINTLPILCLKDAGGTPQGPGTVCGPKSCQ